MAVRKFLLSLNSPESGEVALHTALLLTRRYHAHLQVIHIRPGPQSMGALAGEGVSAAMMDNIITAAERAGEESRQSLTQLFQRAAEAHGVAVGEPLLGQPQASTSFAMLDGREEEVVAFQARVTDLTIVPHPTAGEDVASAEALHAVLFDSGRPVLLAPRTRPAEIGKRIAIAWNGLSTAAAALGSAMPFVRTAEAVRILSSPEYFRRGPIPAEVARYLAHHGVAADIASFAPIRREVGAGLLQAAAEFQADLMVMGAYSSSRLRQLILGGVTRYVLENADLPVLMNR